MRGFGRNGKQNLPTSHQHRSAMRSNICRAVSLILLHCWYIVDTRHSCQIRAFSTARRVTLSNAQTVSNSLSTGVWNTGQSDDDIASPPQLLLQNVVCCVTGASRGIGKGIALELGRQGAIVYVTGTTLFRNTSRLGSLEETAQQVTQLGGVGIPALCDHANDTQVEQLMQRIDDEYGRLDILVNNAFQFPTATGALEFMMQRKFWQQGAAAWDPVHTVGLRSHYIASCYAMPLLLKARDTGGGRPPLIVMISSFGGLTYSFNVAYGVGKAGVDRLVKDMAVELADESIGVVSLWPGVVRTERTEEALENGEWEKYVGLSTALAESPQFTGRAVVALATDDDPARLMKKSGTYQVVAELATEYGFTDVDGSQPPSIRSLRFLFYNYAWDDAQRAKWSPSWIPDWRLPFWIMAQGRPPQ
jgi:dehydrogenase/reductase SDR family member 1